MVREKGIPLIEFDENSTTKNTGSVTKCLSDEIFSENFWHALQKSLTLLGNVASLTRLLKGFLFYIMGSYVRNLNISIPYNLLIAR